jgi:tRNA ligase
VSILSLDPILFYFCHRNNHLPQHRQQLRDAVYNIHPPVRLLALNWGLDQPPAIVHRICRDRIVHRGDSHQTLRADTVAKSHEEVLWSFINDTQDLTPSEVDAVIDMEIEENLDEAVRRAVNGVVKVLGLVPPSEEKITESLGAIERYAPKNKKPDEKRKKGDPTRYYAFLPELDVSEYLDKIFADADEEDESRRAWDLLKLGNRVTSRPHVTIVHKNNIDENRAVWDRCAALHAIPVNPPTFTATLGKAMWNGRVMAITIDSVGLEDAGGVVGKGKEFLKNLPAELEHRLHITVGTARAGILAVEAMQMVLDWNQGSREGVIIQDLDDTVVRGQIKGLIG